MKNLWLFSMVVGVKKVWRFDRVQIGADETVN